MRPPLSLFVLLLSFVAGGCYPATGPAPGDTAEQERFWTTEPQSVRIAALKSQMRNTCPFSAPEEIDAVAAAAVRYGDLLRDDYQLTRPPEHNNVAIALGLKEKRGRCFELADDLYVRLRAMQLKTLDLHRAVSKAGHLTDEHNVVIVTSRGRPMGTGIVLDLWRYAGKIRFLPVKEDWIHEWKERPVGPPPRQLIEPPPAAQAIAAPVSLSPRPVASARR